MKDDSLDRVCAYCEFATVLEDGQNVLCNKKGVVRDNYSCRKFIYDPLKRKPVCRPKFPVLNEDGII